MPSSMLDTLKLTQRDIRNKDISIEAPNAAYL